MKSTFNLRRVTLLRGISMPVLTAGLALTALSNLTAAPALAASPQNRLRANASLTERAALPQDVSRRVTTAQALGHLSGDTPLQTMSLVLAPSAAQNAALDQLLTDQQNPSSPQFHQWLTPEQFGDRFGISDGDLQTLKNWLTSQGLQVLGVAPSRNEIQFSGSASLIESAFRTTLGRFHRDNQDFFENSTAPQIPAAFQGVVAGVTGLSSYRLQAPQVRKHLRASVAQGLSPNVTGTDSAGNIVHALVPYDVRQIYGAAPLYSSGVNGTGQKIGVIGQSAVDLAQLGYFQTLTGQTVKAPTLVLVPNSGTSTAYSGDEGESESDLEYAGGVSPGASVSFVYTGSSANADVITALQYAITANVAPVLTLSYGGCEAASLSEAATLEPYFRQANAQGQTVLVSSGDSGAAGCENGTATVQDGQQVSYPASSPYVTGVGGTTFNDGTGNGTYWSATNNTQLGSALSYIPEVAWNDTTLAKSLDATGGGASVLFSKPTWQTGTGVPVDGARDVPDVAFSASNEHVAYILCTSDTSFAGTNSRGQSVTGACTATALGAFEVGGTSLAAPSFAGLLTLAEQANGAKPLGNINPALYSLASTRPAVFHDVTSGTNIVPCATGTANCPNGSLGFSAGIGYDPVTGLGSMDIGQFSSAITATATAGANVPAVNIEETATTGTVNTYRITVASASSASIPTGTVNVTLDTGAATTVTLANGAASLTLNTATLTAGSHTLRAAYVGDGTHAAATGSLTITTIPTAGTLAISAQPLTVTSGGTGNLTINVTAGGGYSGLVVFDKIQAASGSALPAIGCFLGRNDVSLPANGTFAMTIVFHSLASDCVNKSTLLQTSPLAKMQEPARRPGGAIPALALLLGGGLLAGIASRRKPWMTGLLAVTFTLSLLGMSGCSGSGSTPLSTTTTTGTGTSSTAKGTYTVTLTAHTYPSFAVTSTTNVTLTVQ